MSRVSPHLDTEQKTGYVEINPEDAQELNIKDGEIISLSSRRGTIEAPAQLSTSVGPGVLFVPIHFGENPANMLTNPACDPVAKIPEFKVCAVNIEKLSA